MTTVESGYRGIDEILGRIERVRIRLWTVRVITGAAVLTAVICGGLFAASLCGYWPGQPPALLRWALFIGFCMLVVTSLAIFTVRRLLWKMNNAQAARFIESHMPEVSNYLINSYLLAGDETPNNRHLIQRAIHESSQKTAPLDLSRSIPTLPLKRSLAVAGAALLVLIGFAVLQPGPFRRGIRAALVPGTYVPTDNRTALLKIIPGDAEILAGEPLEITITVEEDRKFPGSTEAGLYLSGEDQPKRMPRMEDEEAATFTYRIDSVNEPFEYHFIVRSASGESRFPADREGYHVSIKKITLKELSVSFKPPVYTGLKEHVIDLKSNRNTPIEVPVDSSALARARFSRPMPRGHMEFAGERSLEMVPRKNGAEWQKGFKITRKDELRLIFTGKTGKTIMRLPSPAATGGDGFYPIRPVADAPPEIAFVTPRQDISRPPGGTVKLMLKASDGYGLTDVDLMAMRSGEKPEQIEGFKPGDLFGKKEITIPFTWALKDYRAGDKITFFATATDNRRLSTGAGPQTTTSNKLTLTIHEEEKLAENQSKQFDLLQKILQEIMRKQCSQRVNTSIASRSGDVKTIRTKGGEIHEGQKAIYADLDTLVTTFPFDEHTAKIKKGVALITANEATVAIEQADIVSRLSALAERDGACRVLGNTQDDIIEALEEILAVMPSMRTAEPEKQSPEGSDLDQGERAAAREDLSEKLKEFIDGQKKAIDAAKRLNKKGLDDFTAEDEKKLEDLAAVEDKWEKFLNEAIADFSKLHNQDFSTASTLKELISVKNDVTMAKDALKKKAKEIAVEAGSASGENAESLESNLEKWLPDKPDREKWNMESPTDQGNVEQPELPEELEDLVGDLLEEEEDLFEEMDDASAMAADSLDKGAGWDAMDGPISSMNAQGVTGNQLPNSSEISGRSGEGRTGKSSGEFVEDKAVGKGGRRTPTRLGEDPFQQGEIKDVSTDPPGGATGGGKKSGSGAGGLEGPAPKDDELLAERLTGKQASLINRAERIQAGFKVGDYAGFRLQRAILLMNRVKKDLENADYRNALRRRDETLGALKDTRRMAGKEIEIAEDQSAAMPKYLKDNINDARSGKLPPEYRPVLEQFYKRLSEQSK